MKIYFILLLIFPLAATAQPSSAVAYTFSGGRLGDNIIAYMHAKWVSYKYSMPLLYSPFPYSDQLKLHTLEQPYNQSIVGKFKRFVTFGKTVDVTTFRNDTNTLYTIPYFPESLEEHRKPEQGINQSNGFAREGYLDFPYFAVDWKDQGFIHELKSFIAPATNLNLVQPPEGYLSVAVHVRKNSGGFDRPLLNGLAEHLYNPSTIYVDVVFPLKHVPDSYFIEQIKKMIEMFPEQKLYVYIFTDDPNPAVIARQYATGIANDSVIFDHRTDENNHYSNVLEDLFSITNFDCFVRGDSNLAIVASKIGDFKVEIAPIHHVWQDHTLIIDQVEITIK